MGTARSGPNHQPGNSCAVLPRAWRPGEGIPRERPWMGKGKEVIREAGRSPGSGEEGNSLLQHQGGSASASPCLSGALLCSSQPQLQVGVLQGRGCRHPGGA